MMSGLAALKLVATSLMAQSKPVIKVNVPFDFVAGAKTLPAGQYQVQTEWPSVVLMQSKDSKSNVNLAMHFDPTRQMSGVAVLRFNRYGNRYFLSGFGPAATWPRNCRSRGRSVSRSRQPAPLTPWWRSPRNARRKILTRARQHESLHPGDLCCRFFV